MACAHCCRARWWPTGSCPDCRPSWGGTSPRRLTRRVCARCRRAHAARRNHGDHRCRRTPWRWFLRHATSRSPHTSGTGSGWLERCLEELSPQSVNGKIKRNKLSENKQWCQQVNRRKEGNVLFNDALNTFYLRLYGVRHMVKDHSNSEKGNLLPPHRLLLSINSKGSFICTIPQTG